MTAFSQENDPLLSSQNEQRRSDEGEQIVQLKRLLVTMKQHYETQVHQLQCELQQEQQQKDALKKEGECCRQQLIHNQKFHEEELQALREQQLSLRELLKKAQEELRQIKEATLTPVHPDAASNRQRVEELEKIVPYLRDRTEEANLEAEQLRDELEQAHKKVKVLEKELGEHQRKAGQESERLKELLINDQVQKELGEKEASLLPLLSLHQEMEFIKKSVIKEQQETQALEARYIEVLNEKIALEHQCKHFQLQLDHQSTNLVAFQGKWRDLEEKKKLLEIESQNKDQETIAFIQQNKELQKKLESLTFLLQDKECLQEKYEQLKEEWLESSNRLEEAIEWRHEADRRLQLFQQTREEQERKLEDQLGKIQKIDQEKEGLKEEKDKLTLLFEENETRLKVAQQHLAKKVKETALLNEKIEEQQVQLTELLQLTEYQKSQLIQFQSHLDLYQKQEKRLQEQLHEALKGTENQIIKWEEKYFRMYDKWQECEERVRELKKFEEKHHQIQHLLANLGSFMGPTPSALSLFATPHDSTEHSSLTAERGSNGKFPEEKSEEMYDLFGMRPLRQKKVSDEP